jgi:hypothetical protein
MLQLSQRMRFPGHVCRDLEGDEPIGKVTLTSEVDASKRPAAQFTTETEAEEVGAYPGQGAYGLCQPFGGARGRAIQGTE